MNGTQLWNAVRREFKKQYPNGTIHRVENTLERGMSDVVYCASNADGDGRAGWIELKGEGDRETPLQRAFRRKWVVAGGDAVVLVVEHGGFGVELQDIDDWYETLAEAITCIVGS